MPFGLRHAPEVCCRFSAVVMFAVVRKVREKGFIVGLHVFIANVVDDWLVLAVTASICDTVWRMLRQLLKGLGFTVNERPHKLSPPAQVVRWVGLHVDTFARMISLPEDKLVKGTALIKDMLARAHQHKSVTRRQVDKLIGYLSFCATVVYGGRAFLHRMRVVRHAKDDPDRIMPPHYHIHLNVSFAHDPEWWRDNLATFNGMARTVALQSTCDVHLDATGLVGLGIFVDGGFVQFAPSDIAQTDVGVGHPLRESANDWELFNFVVLLRTFGYYLANNTVVVDCDNACSVSAIKKFRARSVKAEYTAATLRSLFALCVQFNVRLKPRWIAGKENVLPNALSRQNWRVVSGELSAYISSRGLPPSQWMDSMCFM